MAAGLEQALGEDFLAPEMLVGQVNVPDDQWTPTKKIKLVRCRAGRTATYQHRPSSIRRPESSHCLDGCNQQDLCICLISGGGSALLELPIPPVSLEDLCLVTETMISNGAPIEALNAVRRRISQVKAGGLARVAVAEQLSLSFLRCTGGSNRDDCLWTDRCDPPRPLAPRSNEAGIENLPKYCGPQESAIPQTILDVLKAVPAGSIQTISTNPKQQLLHFVIGNNQMAVEAAAAKANNLGYECQSETIFGEGDAEVVAKRYGRQLHQLSVADPLSAGACLISGGEPTVDLSEAAGRGGRNQHLVLAAILQSLQQDQN